MPMNKEILRQEQPIVYHTLSNALKNKRLAHAYLFTGPKGSPKAETALLLAQSMMCQHPDADGFACGQCDQCKRVEQEESLDFFWKHAIGTIPEKNTTFTHTKAKKTERLKKQDIDNLQAFFEATSAERANARVYILEDYDQATQEASNSLLKFLEEPQPGIYGILIADDKNMILPTIQSRCQTVTFRPPSKASMIQALTEVTDRDSAEMFVESGYTLAQAKELIDQEAFPIIKQAAIDYSRNWYSYAEISRMQTKIFIPKSPLMDKKWIRLWMEWLLYRIKNHKLPIAFETEVSLQRILVEAFDILRAPVDLALFLDKLYTQIRKVVLDEKR